MHDLVTEEAAPAEGQADATLRWGGLAGVVGSLLLLVTFGFTAAFVGADITPEQSLTRFPDIEGARIVENSLYLAVLLLWVLHSLALYRALHRTSPTAALFGTALSVLGLVVLAAGALPHVATAPLSDLYQSPAATSQDQATLVMLWQGLEAVFDALLVTGLVLVPLGLVALGAAMRGAAGFGQALGASTLTLGLIGLGAAVALLVEFSAVAAVGVFALLVFHLVVGRRLHSLSRC